MAKCRITVLECSFNQRYVDLVVEEERKRTLGPCDVFKEGQEFIVDPVVSMPPGFCPWAWDDLYKVLITYFAGGSFGMWVRGGSPCVACCSDGTRPVYFKVEKLLDA